MYSKSVNLDNVGARLRSERTRLEFNQTEFGEFGGVKRNAQVSYETGKSSPTVEYLLRLSEHGVDIGYVLTGRREDGTIGFEESQLIGMLDKLTVGQREALIRLLMEFTGMTIDLSDLKRGDPALPLSALNAPKADYRGDE